jgi:hypothetical protein
VRDISEDDFAIAIPVNATQSRRLFVEIRQRLGFAFKFLEPFL